MLVKGDPGVYLLERFMMSTLLWQAINMDSSLAVCEPCGDTVEGLWTFTFKKLRRDGIFFWNIKIIVCPWGVTKPHAYGRQFRLHMRIDLSPMLNYLVQLAISCHYYLVVVPVPNRNGTCAPNIKVKITAHKFGYFTQVYKKEKFTI